MALHPVPVTVSPDPAPPAVPAPLVQVRLFAAAAAELGADQLDVRGDTLAAVLAALGDGASETARTVIGRSSLLVNGVATTDRTRAMADGDRVDVLPPFAGG